MSTPAVALSQRRGACPGLSVPMPTGDGLLVRLRPNGTVALDAFAGLCAAARTHGNGVVEITARASVQIRGLSAASASCFAATVGALGIDAEDGIPIICNALAGLDPKEICDAGVVAADLRTALNRTALAAMLAPKVSVVVDGGGTPTLDALSADVRLRAQKANGSVVFGVSAGGNGATARELGVVPATCVVDAAVRLLGVIAQHGRAARARDVPTETFCAALSGLISARPREQSGASAPDCGRYDSGRASDAIGAHRLRDGSMACGVGLAFGHAAAATLAQLAAIAEAAGACGMRAAPSRALVIIGLARQAAPHFTADAERLGFIVRHDDPRRYVVACAGAPVCSSGQIPARALAPRLTETVAPFASRSFTLHISGCAKGCACAAPAALTVVGTPAGCALVANGCAGDAPFAVVAAAALAAAIKDHVQQGGRGHV